VAKAEDERAVGKDYTDEAAWSSRMKMNMKNGGRGRIGLFRRHSFGENLPGFRRLSLSCTR